MRASVPLSAGCSAARWCVRPMRCRPPKPISAFGLARARQHSEAIALLHGEPLERGRCHALRQIVRDFDRQSLAYMGIVSFSTGYGGLLPVLADPGRGAPVHPRRDVTGRADAGRPGFPAADLGALVAGRQRGRNRPLPRVGRPRAVAVRGYAATRCGDPRTHRATHRARPGRRPPAGDR